MGFAEYARATSFEKDPLKVKYVLSEDEDYPRLNEDQYGFTITLPSPKLDEETIHFLGYRFPDIPTSRRQVSQLFRASVYHLSGHTLTWNNSDYVGWIEGKNVILSTFVFSLLEDLRVNAYVAAWYPDKIRDLSLAGALMLKRLRVIDNIRITATRLMTSLMIYANTGLKKYCSAGDESTIEPVFSTMDGFKDAILESLVDEEMDINPQKMEAADIIYTALLKHGPIIEAPSPPFAENLGPSCLFPPMNVVPSETLNQLQIECLEGLGGTPLIDGQQSWMKAAEAEELAVFDSYLLEKEKQAKILRKYEEYVEYSRFNSMGFPNKDYSEYLRARIRCKRSVNKLTEVLTGAMNMYMEDILKKYGVLDLTDAIQVIASKSERTDIFIKDEKIKQSFAWAIVIDTSMSMRNIRDYTLETAIVLAESAGKVLMDMTSWSIFAFNDRFEIVKDFSEQYNTRVKARLGGLTFRGLSFMPDAIEIAGKALAKRREELKVMMVISDGWPYGYSNIYPATSVVINELVASNMTVIGIGAQSRRMEFIFDAHCTSYTLKEFVKQFTRRYMAACENAV
jgi:hypothetical protein